MSTKFAPAGRASVAEIEQQAALFQKDPVIEQFLGRIPAVFIVINDQRQIVFMNKGALDFSGMAEVSQALGKRPGELMQCIHSTEGKDGCGTAEACTYCGAVNAVLESQKGTPTVRDARLLLGNDHNAFDLRIWAKPLQFEGEDFTVLTIQDIRNEKWLTFMERIFFHDILNTVSGLSSTIDLLRNYKERVDADELIVRADNITQELLEEIRSQQLLTAAEGKFLAVKLATCKTRDLLNEVIDVYAKHELAEKKALVLDPASQDVEITTDRTLTKRVLGNMVKNALEASPQGSTVSLKATALDKRIIYMVHNDGFIPRDVQMQIFKRSFSTKGKDRGLGTYSMKLLSSFLNGKVTFTTSKDNGTTFIAEYPKVVIPPSPS